MPRVIFFISYARETPDGRDELIQQYYKNGQNGWPDRVESTDIMGNKKFDYTAQDAFAYQVLNKYIQSIKTDGVKPAQSASQNNAGEAITQTPPTVIRYAGSAADASSIIPAGSASDSPSTFFLEVSSRHNILLLETTVTYLSN